MDLSSFSSAVQDLLSEERLAELGPGTPNEKVRVKLTALTVEKLFDPMPVRRRSDAEACLAALWLYHDFQEESHEISQSVSTVEGSYWHGILHRREPDYGNAAYWFRQVGRHPIFESLVPAAEQIAHASDTKLAIPAPWDPFWFIDYCKESARKPDAGQQLAQLIQQREWELLFAYCYDRAVR